MQEMKKIVVDSAKIDKAIGLGIPIAITTDTLPKEIEAYISEVITVFLSKIYQSQIKEYVIYILKELTTNAKKANTKRVYFKEKDLNIFSPEDYEIGMQTFKKDTLENIDYYLDLQKDSGLYIKVSIQLKNNSIIIDVANNAAMAPAEFKRVFDKKVKARQYTDIDEAFMQVIDDTEGAGLGLIIMILMLKKMGLSEDSYDLITQKDMTISRVIIPRDIEIQQQVKKLTKTIVNFIDEVPQFPSKLMEIQRAINNPDVTMSEIADLISGDVALTTDLLKQVNSAAFGLNKECMNIAEAVKLLGLRGIQNLLYSIGVIQTLHTATDEQKELWDHAYQTAFFSYNLSKLTGKRSLMEDAYVCGLLHDLGKIVFSSIYPDTLVKLDNFKAQKNIPDVAFDIVMSGMEHSEIGAALAQKWNLPLPIINTIRYHHNVEASPPEYTTLVATVALADMMAYFLQDSISLEQIPKNILSICKITSIDDFVKLAEMFNRRFHKEKEA
ncbi:HDOD domain-containing protein [Treponema phagedenis]|uniref:HDOD domain-containing protein n=1 Tax=Treponema phagedenis TaxID=162 RepID=A0AAE6IS41_TREPH|nr:HDOD domain-containing protein [Treponema phagedenis]QEJ97163.1 HDOD domain-containing protein [Treponema phagedenis]